MVQSGADLEAKTKNGETPLDICEDPELKERIVQLKNEMETKRNSSHSNRLKRSHSSNTRTQSVRRTSIREKSQISRREAKLEAKMRSQGNSDGINTIVTDTDTDTDTTTTVSVDTRASAMPDLVKSTSPAVNDQSVTKNYISSTTAKGKSAIIDVNGSSSSAAASAAFDPPDNKSSGMATAKVSSHQESSSQSTTTQITSSNLSSKKSNNDGRLTDNTKSSESKNNNGGERVVKKNDNVIKNPGYSDRDNLFNSSSSNDPVTKSSSDTAKNTLMNSSSREILDRGDQSSDRKSSGESAVKVEIHVTVNTTAGQSPTNGQPIQSLVTGPIGTLADLKKLRTESRRGSDRNSAVINGDVVDGQETVDTSAATNGNNNTTIRARYVVDSSPTGSSGSGKQQSTMTQIPLHQPPPSPSRPNIYRGDPSEVVGGNGGYHKQGCCTIS